MTTAPHKMATHNAGYGRVSLARPAVNGLPSYGSL